MSLTAICDNDHAHRFDDLAWVFRVGRMGGSFQPIHVFFQDEIETSSGPARELDVSRTPPHCFIGASTGAEDKERLTAQIPSVPNPQTNLRRPFASVISLQSSNIKSSPHLELLAYSFRIEEIDIHPVFIVFCRRFRYANDHVHHLVPLIACHRRRIVD